MTPVYITYLPGSGGKFLANCLYLCDEVIFNEYNIAKENNTQLILDRVLKTVPPLEDRHNWINYEVYNMYENPGDVLPAEQQRFLQEYQGYLPVVANYSETMSEYITQLGKGSIIQIFPENDFIDLAIALKWSPLDNDSLPSMCINQYQDWQKEMQPFNCDIQIYDFNPLNDSIYDSLQQVFTQLNITGIRWDDIHLYIQKYRKFHSKGKQLLGL